MRMTAAYIKDMQYSICQGAIKVEVPYAELNITRAYYMCSGDLVHDINHIALSSHWATFGSLLLLFSSKFVSSSSGMAILWGYS